MTHPSGEDLCQGMYKHNCSLWQSVVCLGGFLIPVSLSGTQCVWVTGSSARWDTHAVQRSRKGVTPSELSTYVIGELIVTDTHSYHKRSEEGRSPSRSGASSVLWSQTRGLHSQSCCVHIGASLGKVPAPGPLTFIDLVFSLKAQEMLW